MKLPYMMEDRTRHGKPRLRVRIGRRKMTITGKPGTPEFLAAYTAAVERLKSGAPLKGAKPAKPVQRAPKGSLGWLMEQYFGSGAFLTLDAESRGNRRSVIEACLTEPIKPGSRHLMRDCPYKRVTAAHIMMLRDRKVQAGKPGAANNRKKYLSAAFAWAIEERKFGLVVNPCRDAKKVRYVSDGYYTWTADDVYQFIARHPLGTKAYLAMCLMLFLGARKQDAIRLGPKNMRDGVMRYVPKKTTYVRVDESVKPILPPLAEAIRRTPIGLKTFLLNEYGQPFTDAGFGNRMRAWCDQAGLPECSSHGLKKIAATLAADMGATDRMMMALFDWMSEKQANVYTAKANKAKLAADAARLLGQFSLTPPGGDHAQTA